MLQKEHDNLTAMVKELDGLGEAKTLLNKHANLVPLNVRLAALGHLDGKIADVVKRIGAVKVEEPKPVDGKE